MAGHGARRFQFYSLPWGNGWPRAFDRQEGRLHLSQNWCCNVYEFILNIKAKGGYKIESFELDNGLTILQKDDKLAFVVFKDSKLNDEKILGNIYRLEDLSISTNNH